MGGGKDKFNRPEITEKGLYSGYGHGYGGGGSYLQPQSNCYGCPPPPVAYQPQGYFPPQVPYGGYPPAGYPPPGYPVTPSHGYGHGPKPGMGALVAGGAAAAAALTYGAHHMPHSHGYFSHGNPYGHHGYGFGNHGKFKRHGGKFKHGGKFGKWK